MRHSSRDMWTLDCARGSHALASSRLVLLLKARACLGCWAQCLNVRVQGFRKEALWGPHATTGLTRPWAWDNDGASDRSHTKTSDTRCWQPTVTAPGETES